MQAYSRGEVTEAELETLALHIDNCSTCEQLLLSWAQTSGPLEEALRRSAREAAPEDDSLVRRLQAHLAPAAPLVAPIPLELPFEFGKYVLLEQVGGGGMGVVYRAMQTSLNRIVAVKVLSPQLSSAPAIIRRFQHESRLVGGLGLRQPHLVSALDAEFAEGRAFLVMEYIDGIDLARLVRAGGPLPIAAVGEIGYQAAQGLQSLAELGLVHRDIKPSNLMLADGVVRLLDFGLARFADDVDDASELTAVGQFLGTVDYISPEQIRDPRRVDSRADVYSLGCTLFFLLTGRAPFGGQGSREEKCRAHQVEAPPDIRQLRPEVPPLLAEIVMQMLEKDPAARSLDAADVVRKLESYSGRGQLGEVSNLLALAPGRITQVGSTVELRPANVSTQPRTHHSGRRWATSAALALVAAALLVAVLVAGGIAWSSSGVTSEAPETQPSLVPGHEVRQAVAPQTLYAGSSAANSFFQVNEATNKLHLVTDDFLMVKLGTIGRKDARLQISVEVSELKSEYGHAGVFVARRDRADHEQGQFQSIHVHTWSDGKVFSRRSLDFFHPRTIESRSGRDIALVPLPRALRINTLALQVAEGRLLELIWNGDVVEKIDAPPADAADDNDLTGVFGVFASRSVAVFSEFEFNGESQEFEP